MGYSVGAMMPLSAQTTQTHTDAACTLTRAQTARVLPLQPVRSPAGRTEPEYKENQSLSQSAAHRKRSLEIFTSHRLEEDTPPHFSRHDDSIHPPRVSFTLRDRTPADSPTGFKWISRAYTSAEDSFSYSVHLTVFIQIRELFPEKLTKTSK